MYPARLTADGYIPLYIFIPLFMPTRHAPWVVSVTPCALLHIGAKIELPVVGRARVDALVEDVHDYYVFRVRVSVDRSYLYLRTPKAWTTGIPTRPLHIRRVRSWWAVLRTT